MSGEQVSVFIAGPDMSGTVLKGMYPAFNADAARFQVLSLAADWTDMQRNVAQYRPEALVLEAALAPDPNTLRNYLTTLAGTIAIIVLPPTQAWADNKGLFEAVTGVRGVFIGPANWTQVANATYSAAVTERSRMNAAAPMTAVYQAAPTGVGARPAPLVVGTRTIAFTSFAGGTGKSTIAETVAVELARNHVKTLLCSFNSPPAAVGHMGLKFAPSSVEWFNRPTPEGFQAALQKMKGLEDLDVLLAPEDPDALFRAAASPPEAPASIQQLVFSAYSFNYGAILLDLPPFADSMWAVQAILAANMAVLVGRCTVHDQFAAIRAYKLFTEQLAAKHRIPLDAIFAVLNLDTPDDNMSERDFQAGIAQQIGRFPPILATFPYVSKLPAVQNRGDSPALAAECDSFARAARSLASKLVGGTPLSGEGNGGGGNGLLNRLGIKIKVK